MKINAFLAPLLLLSAEGAISSLQAESLAIVREQQSPFVIVYPETAPASVREAAAEMQRCIREATGVTLEVLHDDEETGERPVISIGATRQAKQAGIDATDLPDDGYRIAFHEGNVFIRGIDTPDHGWTKGGGVSRGSANGVYVFLEESLDVRWLMPGDDGRDVPKRPEWTVDTKPRSGGPFFHMRELSHLSDFATPQQVATIRQWMSRSRLGSSVAIRHINNRRDDHWQHNWAWITDDPEMFRKHPEWFAMNAEGKRWHPGNHYAKLETTNNELIRFFADRAITTLRNSPRPRVFSLTPNDAPSRWSESKESKALYDPPIGEGVETAEFKPRVASKTSLVMQWYHDVATLVKAEYPEGRLTGFVYSDYLYPPVKFTGTLPDNLSLVLCGPNYGYELNSAPARKRLAWLMKAWQRLAPGGLYYYDIPSLLLRQEDSDARYNFPGTTALLTPAAPDSLNFLFTLLREHKIGGAYLYGAASWSSAAMTNYVVARLFWDPHRNALELQKEWLERAYGPGAAEVMGKLYGRLDEIYKSYGHIGYNLTAEMMKEIYAKHFGEMEGYYLEATKQPMNEVQRRRLEGLGRNLSALQWRLANMGLWDKKESPLALPAHEVISMLSDQNGDYPDFPGILPSSNAFDPDFVEVNPVDDLAAAKKPELSQNTWAVMHAREDRKVEIVPEVVDHGAYVATYLVKDQGGEVIVEGILNAGQAISFQAQAGGSYYFFMPPRSRRSAYPTRCELRVKEVALAEVAADKRRLKMKGGKAAVYIWGDKGGMKAVGKDVIFRK